MVHGILLGRVPVGEVGGSVRTGVWVAGYAAGCILRD